jgi:exodeoxyribonuclease VII small subunit
VTANRPVEDLGYAEALAELEAILRELDGPAVDVDRLTEHVARARALIGRCRERLADARLHIEQVVAEETGG